MLVDHADTERVSVLGRGYVDLLAVDEYLAGVLMIYAGQHIHQSGLAGAVLTQQSEYLALFDIKRYVLVGDDLGTEGLGDVPQAYGSGFVLQYIYPL